MSLEDVTHRGSHSQSLAEPGSETQRARMKEVSKENERPRPHLHCTDSTPQSHSLRGPEPAQPPPAPGPRATGTTVT